jgi:hypothetical protein
MYFELGWEHIISLDALDHQLFILVLAAVYSLREWKKVIVLVTAFTIGHSITLALSATEIIDPDPFWVEFLIPLTIVITAVSNFFYRSTTGRVVSLNYFLALFFGLIHGLGFANTIRFMLPKDESIVGPLISFNLGLEAGQIVLVALILAVSWLFLDVFRLNRRWWIWGISAIVFIVALKITIDRIPF